MELQEIAQSLRPKGKQESSVKKTVDKINLQLKKDKIKAECTIAGSFAKGVYLEEDFDVDLFVRFNLMYKNQNLSNMLESVLKKIYKKIERVKGSRDYFHIEDKLNYEIVPVLNIKKAEDAQNITDFSPGHVDFVLKNIKKNPKLRDEIRLTKQFLKAQNLYGAESFINGFSGHVVDILIIYYKSFLNLIKAASKWQQQTVIDIQKHYKKNELLFRLSKSKITSLVLIDPLQKERNAAAALSKENYEKFIASCKVFLKEPSESFFIKPKFDINSLKAKNNLIIEAKPFKGNKDIVGTKVYKAFQYLKIKIEENGFTIENSGWNFGERSFLYFKVKESILDEYFIRQGPSIKMKQHVTNFKMTHKKTFTKSGKIFAKVKRQHRTLKSFSAELLKDPYVKQKASSWSIKWA